VTPTVPAAPAPAQLAPVGLPRLLLGGPDLARPMRLAEHLERHGGFLLRGFGGDRAPTMLIDAVERAGLTGHGGAGFPTARKMRAVAGRRRPVVVVNAAEGEPASRKDAYLMHTRPHLVLDGAVLAADAVGAHEVIVALHAGPSPVSAAVAERQAAGLDPVAIKVVQVPKEYVASEETALVRFLSGAPALPTFTPPRPFERGVNGRSTLVQNAETLAHLALIARHGDEWFRSVGTPDAPGSLLVTVAGAVQQPGVYELAFGMPLKAAFEAAGGLTEPVQAVLVGGYFGAWLPAETALRVRLTPADLVAAGAAIGAGVLLALPESSCGLAESQRVATWLAVQSAGQCGPCAWGLPAIAEDLAVLTRSGNTTNVKNRLERRLRLVEGRGACHHPDGTARFVASALRTFSADLARHRRGNPCPPTRHPVLPLPDDPERR
jgi:NADH:ubiquinone oxidoreductase subunit F (NADH-binding)